MRNLTSLFMVAQLVVTRPGCKCPGSQILESAFFTRCYTDPLFSIFSRKVKFVLLGMEISKLPCNNLNSFIPYDTSSKEKQIIILSFRKGKKTF